jgi:hypothetical protein
LPSFPATPTVSRPKLISETVQTKPALGRVDVLA